jgi:hypothetical protein
MGINKTIKLEDRIDAEVEIEIHGNGGPVAQMLHPQWIGRNDTHRMMEILRGVGDRLSAHSSDVKLIVTGGGFVEITYSKMHSRRDWHSEAVFFRSDPSCPVNDGTFRCSGGWLP